MKKLLSIVLSLAMVLSIAGVMTVSAATVEKEYSLYAETFEGLEDVPSTMSFMKVPNRTIASQGADGSSNSVQLGITANNIYSEIYAVDSSVAMADGDRVRGSFKIKMLSDLNMTATYSAGDLACGRVVVLAGEASNAKDDNNANIQVTNAFGKAGEETNHDWIEIPFEFTWNTSKYGTTLKVGIRLFSNSSYYGIKSLADQSEGEIQFLMDDMHIKKVVEEEVEEEEPVVPPVTPSNPLPGTELIYTETFEGLSAIPATMSFLKVPNRIIGSQGANGSSNSAQLGITANNLYSEIFAVDSSVAMADGDRVRGSFKIKMVSDLNMTNTYSNGTDLASGRVEILVGNSANAKDDNNTSIRLNNVFGAIGATTNHDWIELPFEFTWKSSYGSTLKIGIRLFGNSSYYGINSLANPSEGEIQFFMDDMYIGKVVEEEEEEVVNAISYSAGVTTATSTESSAIILYVSYDATTNSITDFVKVENAFASSTSYTANALPADFTPNAGDIIKVMLWKDLTNCVPLCANAEATN